MQNAIAFANNDVITVAWSFGQKLEGCMGFAVYRIDANGKETALPAVAVFPGFKRAATDTCETPGFALISHNVAACFCVSSNSETAAMKSRCIAPCARRRQ